MIKSSLYHIAPLYASFASFLDISIKHWFSAFLTFFSGWINISSCTYSITSTSQVYWEWFSCDYAYKHVCVSGIKISISPKATLIRPCSVTWSIPTICNIVGILQILSSSCALLFTFHPASQPLWIQGCKSKPEVTFSPFKTNDGMHCSCTPIILYSGSPDFYALKNKHIKLSLCLTFSDVT